jgi:outer membrane biosynthesis protein TonB
MVSSPSPSAGEQADRFSSPRSAIQQIQLEQSFPSVEIYVRGRYASDDPLYRSQTSIFSSCCSGSSLIFTMKSAVFALLVTATSAFTAPSMTFAVGKKSAAKKVAPKAAGTKVVKAAAKVAPKPVAKKVVKPVAKVATKPVVKVAPKKVVKPVVKKVAPKVVAKKVVAKKVAPKAAAKKIVVKKTVAKKPIKKAVSSFKSKSSYVSALNRFSLAPNSYLRDKQS